MKIKRYSGNPAPGLPDTTNIADPQLRLFLDRIKVAITAIGEIDVGNLASALMNDSGFRKQLDKVITVTAGKVAKEKAGEILDDRMKNLPGSGNSKITYKIDAVYAWSDGDTTVYTESANPSAGALFFDQETVSGEFDRETDYYQAKISLAAGTVSSATTKEYIAAGEYCWRNEEDDVVVSYSPVAVQTQEHPRGLQPSVDLWRETTGSPVVIGKTVGRLFAAACATDTPTLEQARTYSVAAQAIDALAVWQTKALIVGNYNSGDFALEPYLVPTGASATAFYFDDDDNKVYYTLLQMANFTGATATASAYVRADYVNDDTQTSAQNVTVSAPVQDPDTGEWENTDWTSIRRLSFTAFSLHGLWYKNEGSGSRSGYVFGEVIIAEAWTRPPVFSGGKVYTCNTDGQRDLSVAYQYSDFSGSPTSVTGHGNGTYLIVSVGGNTYYNAQTPEA